MSNPRPTAGGRYTRSPETGELTPEARQETEAAEPALAIPDASEPANAESKKKGR